MKLFLHQSGQGNYSYINHAKQTIITSITLSKLFLQKSNTFRNTDTVTEAKQDEIFEHKVKFSVYLRIIFNLELRISDSETALQDNNEVHN